MKLFKALTVGLFGIIITFFLGTIIIIVGFLLSLTLIGAIIGVPLIIFGLMLMASGPFAGVASYFSKKMNCPICNNELIILNEKAITCKYCKKRLLIDNKKLIAVV